MRITVHLTPAGRRQPSVHRPGQPVPEMSGFYHVPAPAGVPIGAIRITLTPRTS
jgi:hypothetical protein